MGKSGAPDAQTVAFGTGEEKKYFLEYIVDLLGFQNLTVFHKASFVNAETVIYLREITGNQDSTC